MEVKYSTLLLLFSINLYECSPVNARTYVDLDSQCNFPPISVTAVYEEQWGICTSDSSQSDIHADNPNLKLEFFNQICTRIGMLQKNHCYPLKNISFPFDSVLEKLFDFDPANDEQKLNQSKKLCTSMKGMKDFVENDCIGMCLEIFSVCNVYAVTEEILRNNFSTAVHKDYKQLEYFIHPRELGQFFVFPPRGSLHQGYALVQCMEEKPSNETDTLCKAVAEVAINISDTRTVMKLNGFEILKNVSNDANPWEPCDGFPDLLKNVDCDCMKVFKNKTSCNDICTKGGQQICKMIYLGLESLLCNDGTSKVDATLPSNDNAITKPVTPSPKPDATPKPDPIMQSTSKVDATLPSKDMNDNAIPKPVTPKPDATPKPDPIMPGTQAQATKNNGTDTNPEVKNEVANATTTTTSTTTTPVRTTSVTTIETVKPTTLAKEHPELPPQIGHLSNQSGTSGAADGKNANSIKTTEDKTSPSPTTTTTTTETPAITATSDYDDLFTDYEDGENDSNGTENEDDHNTEEPENMLENKGDEPVSKKVENRKPSTDVDEEEEGSGGHFMAYFLVFIVLCVAGYIVFHNKQKIIALVIEGKNASAGRRPSSKDYKKLKTEDVMPSLEKSAYSKNYVF